MLVPGLRGGPRHLCYCANVHPAESARDVIAVVEGPLAHVRHGLADALAGRPFAAGLRLSARAAFELRDDAFLVEELGDALLAADAYALTVNAFPFGDFHGAAIKENVYRPDWTSDARVDYTLAVAEVMAALPSASAYQSISTAPGSYRGFGRPDFEAIAARLAKVAAELYMLDMQYERPIVLAVEPEPGCTFSTTGEWIAFFEDVLLRGRWPALEALKPGKRDFQEAILRRHVTLCFDACHAAVELEDPRAAIERLGRHGLRIGKMQISSALRVTGPLPGGAALAQLARFDEPVYLHQTTARDAAGDVHRFDDLGAFLAAASTREFAEARTHFHVPIFAESLGGLGTTRAELLAAIAAAIELDATEHLEIETYSWHAIPEHRGDAQPAALVGDIVREYRWALDAIAAAR
jgi:sugar phosphate isomerase/epimerase